MRMKRLSALAALALLSGAPALAQDHYPTRTVRLVVGFGAGGPTDIPARFLADKLGTLLGQRMIVENKTGAAGMIATRDVLGQQADGYSLLLCTHFESINTVLYKNPGFKLADVVPISLIARYYYGMAVANAVPAKTFEEFVQYAKTHPGELSYGTIGAGSAQEIMARQLEKLAGNQRRNAVQELAGRSQRCRNSLDGSRMITGTENNASVACTAESSFVSCSMRAVISRPASSAIRIV